MKLIETEWHTYRKAVLPRDASATQVLECRRAFYGGAWAFYSFVMTHMEPGTEDTPQDLDLMAKLDAELREFRDRVVKGHA